MPSRWCAFLVVSTVACHGSSNAPRDSGKLVDAASIDGAIATIDGPTDLPAGVFAIPLTTPADDSGLSYIAKVSSSGQTFGLLLDTGSTVVAIAGNPCESCTGLSPRYTPDSGAVDTHTTDTNVYASGAGYAGEIYTDDVGLAHGSPSVALNLVDIQVQTDFFNSNNDYQGILGASRDALLDDGTTGYITNLVKAGVTDKVGLELCPDGGTFWLGGFDPSHAGSDMVFTPLLQTTTNYTGGYPNSYFYAVDLSGMKLGAVDVGMTEANAGQPILDSGTSLFYVPDAVETAAIAALNASSGFATLFPGQTMTDPTGSGSGTFGCVTAGSGVTDEQIDAMLPPLTMTFGSGNAAVTIQAPPLASYLMDAGQGQYCMGMWSSDYGIGVSIMGDTFLRGFVTVIDLVNEQAGFAPDTYCHAPAASQERAFHAPRERGARGRP
jgi:hypothetical protein